MPVSREYCLATAPGEGPGRKKKSAAPDSDIHSVRAAPEQIFDSGGVFGGDTSKGVPVVSYGDDVDFAARMREDFDNCEYRTCFVDFAPRAV